MGKSRRIQGLRLIGITIGLILLLPAAHTGFAQEPPLTDTPTPTPTETPTATLTPTSTATQTPILTNTSTATATASPTATNTSTATATETPSPTSTSTATETASSSPTPTIIANLSAPTRLFFDNAEAGDQNWTFAGSWGISQAENPYEGTSTFADSPGVAYASNTNAAMTLAQPIGIPGNAQVELRFWEAVDLREGAFASLELSTDGLNWTALLTHPSSPTPLAWTEQVIDLSAYSGQYIWLRFALQVNPGVTALGDGWLIDSIAAEAVPLSPVPTETPTPTNTPSETSEADATETETPTPNGTPTPTEAPKQSGPQLPDADGWINYADTDPSLVYGDGNWQAVAIAAAEGGTLTYTTDVAASLRVSFEGTGFRVIFSRGPEGGEFAVALDGVEYRSVSGYNDSYEYKYAIELQGLDNTIHELIVVNGSGALWIEAIHIQTSTPELGFQAAAAGAAAATSADPIEFKQWFEDADFTGPNELIPIVMGEPLVYIDTDPSTHQRHGAIVEIVEVMNQEVWMEVNLELDPDNPGHTYQITEESHAPPIINSRGIFGSMVYFDLYFIIYDQNGNDLYESPHQQTGSTDTAELTVDSVSGAKSITYFTRAVLTDKMDEFTISLHTFTITAIPEQIDPTTTPTPDGACLVKIVHENTAPEATQEAFDMLAVVAYSDYSAGIQSTTQGLYLHEGPVLNANQKSIILPWSKDNAEVVVEATYRAQFPRSGTADQIWYGIEEFGGTPFASPVWFAAKMGSNWYIDGGVEPAGCDTLTEPSTYTFTYDRQAAAEYAIAQAYQNDNIYTPGDQRVTARLDNTVPGIPSEVLSLYPQIPFADFEYRAGQLNHSQPGFTGSALFISQSAWVGGFPMTMGAIACQDPLGTEPPPANVAGWHYCPEANGFASLPWRAHNVLGGYFTDTSPFAPFSVDNNVLGDDIFTPLEGEGFAGYIHWFEFNTIYTLSTSEFLLADSREQIYTTIIQNPERPLLTDIERGDYVWIESVTYNYIDTNGDGDPDDIERDSGEPVLVNDYHGFMVAGWGPIEECDYVIDIGTDLYPDFASASEPVVPYVVDFSGPIQNGLQIQSSRPRSFYCSWLDGGFAKDTRPGFEEWSSVPLYANPFGLEGRHNWYFYKLPSEVVLSVSGIYFSQEWNWGNDTGSPVVSGP